jgi:GTP-binding protein
VPFSAEFVKGVVALDGLPDARLPEVAVSGRSNVGKSSLLNVIFARKGLAKVSQTPGKTREINFFRVGTRFHLVDLPGYGFAKVPVNVQRKWAALVEQYLETREQLAGIVQLVDIRHGPSRQDQEMLEWLASAGRPALLVATKADKLKRGAQAAAVEKLRRDWPAFDVVSFSAVTRAGEKPVSKWIGDVVDAWPRRPGA